MASPVTRAAAHGSRVVIAAFILCFSCAVVQWLAAKDGNNPTARPLTLPADSTQAILADIRKMNVGQFDWPQWGGSRYRMNTPSGSNIPESWEPGEFNSKTGAWIKDRAKNIKWVAPLGSQTYGNPVVANGKIFVGTNNGHSYLKRFPETVDLGVLLCFKEATGEFLWQHSNEKLGTGRAHDWPLQGVCSTPAVDGDRLWYVNNRGEVVCLDVEGFADGEDDGPEQGLQLRVFDLTANLATSDPGKHSEVDSHTLRALMAAVNMPLRRGHLTSNPAEPGWRVVEGSPPLVLNRLTIESPDLCIWSPADKTLPLARIEVNLAAGLDNGSIGSGLRRLLASLGFELPATATVEVLRPGQSWKVLVTQAAGKRDYQLDLQGGRLICTTPLAPPLEHEADVVWRLDMMKELGVSQHNMSNCSPLLVNDWLFVCTSNGVDQSHTSIPNPDAPSFIALNRWTGKLLWQDNAPGLNILHSQWASPCYGVLEGQPQVIFPGGDGWVYSFDPAGDGRGKSKLLWKFDGNFKDAKYILAGRGLRNEIIAFPCIYDGLVYIVMGQDPEHGEGLGCLWCINPAKQRSGGDVSESLAVDLQGQILPHRKLQAIDPALGERAIPNLDSAVVWRYVSQDRNADGRTDFEEDFHRSLSTPVIKDDILYIADFSGLFHCLNAKTGKVHWTHDLLAACWSTALMVEDKVYIADEDGDVAVFRHSSDPLKAMRKDGAEHKPWHGQIAMPNSIYMTPIVANNVLYVATKSHLFAIARE